MKTRLSSPSSATSAAATLAVALLLLLLVVLVPTGEAFIVPETNHHKKGSIHHNPLYIPEQSSQTSSSSTSSVFPKNNLKAASLLTEAAENNNAVAQLDLTQWLQQQQQQQQQRTFIAKDWMPVVSAALLITSNTVGAGCLVMPELAAGPGLVTTCGIFALSYAVNLVSGLVLADVAISQAQQQGSDDDDNNAVPSSFQEFAAASLQSPVAANIISALSIATNGAVHAFASAKVGLVGSALLGGMVPPALISMAWAAAWWTLLTTQSSKQLSQMANVFCTALFATFGALVVPGLAHLDITTAAVAIPPPALQGEAWTAAVAHAAPVMLMSMVYQNIVPTITKLLDYNRRKVVTAIAVGSFLPMVMYLSWCLVCLSNGAGGAGGGDSVMTDVLFTTFSAVTLAGSSLGTSLSMSNELETFFQPTTTAAAAATSEEQEQVTAAATTTTTAKDDSSSSSSFGPLAAAAAVGLPLGAALLFADGSGGGFTEALSVAGSFGSPLLYGAIPVAMAWRQRQQQQQAAASSAMPPLVPGASLPLLGACSVGFIGQEVAQRVSEAATAMMI